MDIENMHPFCLPFGLCYDATSSSINDSSIFADGKHANRSKTSSPSDELFRQLNSSCHHDSLIIDESILDANDTDDVFQNSLELDVDLSARVSSPDTAEFDSFNGSSGESGAKTGDDDAESEDNDWYSTSGHHSQFSLFSPTLSSRGGGKSIEDAKAHQHNLVFQHIVDPIDIKSSPTLAQLNLNANDDPSDCLWDATHATNSTRITPSRSLLSSLSTNGSTLMTPQHLSTSSALGLSASASMAHLSAQQQQHLSLAHGNTDLAPTCTSIVNGSHASALSNGPHGNATCNHLNRNHLQHMQSSNHLHNHHTQGLNLYSCPRASSPLCHHMQHGSLRPAQQVASYCQPANSLLATSGADLMQQQNTHSSTTNQCNSLRSPSSSLINGQQQGEQRSASPAHVTSSSSPLLASISAVGALPTTVSASPPAGDASKLKENIEYLTALLCNGSSKLDQANNNNNSSSNNNDSITQQQQPNHHPAGGQSAASLLSPPSISSTMVRSYTTLAHSLSTGPKLLERGVQQQPSAMSMPFGKSGHIQQQQMSSAPANEATPFDLNGVTANHLASGLKGPAYGQELATQRWVQNKAGDGGSVESSVSAADSTECQVSSLTSGCELSGAKASPPINHHLHRHHQQQQAFLPANNLLIYSACSLHSHPLQQQQQSALEQQHLNQQQTKRSGADSKVLSSLLGANRCPSPQCSANHVQSPSLPPSAVANSFGQRWQPSPNHVQHGQDAREVPVPANGKPITLTPLNSSNGILINQQQAPKPRPNSVFAQPASPSTSSTTSSGGGLEGVASSPSTNGPPSSKKLKAATGQQKPASGNANRKAGKGRTARPSSLSTDCSLSSHDEGFSSQVDQDECGSARDSDEDDDDVDSDDESFYGDYTNSDLIGASISDNADNKWTLNMGRTRRNGQKRYFWQYNVQSKGPKGARICSADNPEDPFVLPEASDPVFSNDCQVEGVKHSGKARRGDGNDLTPNPRKLLMIGLELKKLGKIINDLAPVTDLPVNARNKTRKEKNKLASRACRLKKKAQHEANKIKLYGLQKEHQQVVVAIFEVRKLLKEEIQRQEASGQRLADSRVSSHADPIADQCSLRVAGLTSDYVNSVLEKVVSGCIDGGLST